MKKFNTLFFLCLALISISIAQTPQQVVIEHFTNTLCSDCANDNPQFYSNLHTNYPQILHVAYDPSSPYPADTFNLLNKPENDARTKFYRVYGSTPRAVLQGEVIPINYPLVTNNYYASAINRYSSFEVGIRMQEVASDSVKVTTVVTTTGPDTFNVLHLYEVITEDTIFYNAPNGEAVFYDVFHTQLYPGNGLTFAPSQTIGDSVVFTSTFYLDPAWVKDRVNVTGLLQDTSSKEVVQSGRQTTIEPANSTTGIKDVGIDESIVIYPNPANNIVHFDNEQQKTVVLYSCDGQMLQERKLSGSLDVSGLENGIYILRISMDDDNASEVRRLVVMH